MSDTAIGSLTSASAFAGTEVLPVLESGTNKKATTSLLASTLATTPIVTIVDSVKTATGSNPTPAVPTGIASGDFCVFLCSTDNVDADASGPEGGGWTQVFRFNPSTGENRYLWYKTADGSEPSTWDLTTSNTAGTPHLTACAVAAFRGGTLHDITIQNRHLSVVGPEAVAGGVAIYGFQAALGMSSDPTTPRNISGFTFVRSTNTMSALGYRSTPFGGDAGDVSVDYKTPDVDLGAFAITLRPS